jgi:mRNA interferase RelE/StbE
VKVELTKRAVKDLDGLEKAQPKLYDKMVAKIKALEQEPTLGKPLVGPLRGRWSLRVGEYRAIYETGKDVVTILTVNHRREVYR